APAVCEDGMDVDRGAGPSPASEGRGLRMMCFSAKLSVSDASHAATPSIAA
ncbi:MAG: hypothetical protein QOG65_2204, partial [Actinomycetota bacterium]|nr:hypothetical protein [Actinomycetota bacterium]